MGNTVIRLAFLVLIAIAPLTAAAADDGIVTRPSPYPVAETIDRLDRVLKDRKVTVFVRVDHAAEAEKASLKMPPAQLLVFGNPRAGTPLMLAAPKIALDLPMKALAWQDAGGKVWISFNSAEYLKRRHGLSDDLAKNVAVIDAIVDAALK
ncbi:MAG: DUF302 domain-containing protein [Rhodospirillales bacterium]|nr:MAG: DUF302 domain-containing protein [Rhodospirillales bacterium]